MCSIRTVIALLSVCACTTQATAQAPGGWQDFTRRFQDYVDADQGVGASVVLVRSGKVIGRYDTGLAERAKNRKGTKK